MNQAEKFQRVESPHARRLRDYFDQDELADYFLAVWNDVIGPRCGGRNEFVLKDFVQHHLRTDYPATEWRFQGRPGFGGKLRTADDGTCSVSCYPEDSTPERREIIELANRELAELRVRLLRSKAIALPVDEIELSPKAFDILRAAVTLAKNETIRSAARLRLRLDALFPGSATDIEAALWFWFCYHKTKPSSFNVE